MRGEVVEGKRWTQILWMGAEDFQSEETIYKRRDNTKNK